MSSRFDYEENLRPIEHWYLLIVDLYKRYLVLLDSMKTAERIHKRVLAVKTLEIFIERMFIDASFYKFQVTYRPKISTFSFVEPAGIGEQKKGWNDYAIWVTSWMRECWWSNNYAIEVNDSTRTQLAIDLVLKEYNSKRDNMISSSREYFKQLKDKNKRLKMT
ncbi:hypothetical protein PIB30_038449 [Stylosanthes scabra]|uniref:Ubiquitin-like protease family profile domain-containing protein n=1 Tax=Stylosanthes scabra TaxID=79078 RepID=A0ABU6XFU9_9FABA|nr:hypothetical protein [Stylosanthes scabra]